jgi:hypothetical protein
MSGGRLIAGVGVGWSEAEFAALGVPFHERGARTPLLVMDPIVARLFVERGMDTKQKLIDWCAENARLPVREYWDDQWVQTLLRPLASSPMPVA